MSRVFRGTFGPLVHADPDLRLASTRRLLIRVIILIGRERLTRHFLIDTGADFTIVQPELASFLLKATGQDSGDEVERKLITMNGVGPTPLRCQIQPAGLSTVDDAGEELIFSSPVLIPQPDARQGSGRRSGVVPSLLGRDVLSRFDLNLSYDPPSVTLALND